MLPCPEWLPWGTVYVIAKVNRWDGRFLMGSLAVHVVSKVKMLRTLCVTSVVVEVEVFKRLFITGKYTTYEANAADRT